ncbi:ADP-ribosyltransferase exoenzyme [Carpediemonas membranifera]|uniref:ADP-ribosyltransferase exoenzyme n=1 Tax=Carpediemonas membranifera TaxID=201153 RepID=A0A8J6EBG7_9EUKA|nr:ADP-ribosyltransferase exoenzyme [Carpediemonas membranifera]|eukprot:KAG9397150.1 ADP-ribosyltransferase exoenzyme [Carpediemonas membranifera]
MEDMDRTSRFTFSTNLQRTTWEDSVKTTTRRLGAGNLPAIDQNLIDTVLNELEGKSVNRSLTGAHKYAIWRYSTNDYYDINQLLRSDADIAASEWNAIIRHANHGVRNVTSSDPHTTTLYRGLQIDPNLEVGDQFYEWGFTSCSRSRTVAEGFAGDGPICRIVEWRYGLNIENLSEYPHEQETLLPINACFEVTKVTEPSGVQRRKVYTLKQRVDISKNYE